MFDEKRSNIKVDQITLPGKMLANHYTTVEGRKAEVGEMPPAIEKILSKNWNIVILQDAPVPLLIPEERICYETAVVKFDSLIKSKNGKTLLFQNYTLSNTPVRFCHPSEAVELMMEGLVDTTLLGIKEFCCSDSFQNSTQEFLALEKEVKNMANNIHAQIAPIGYTFEVCKKKYPEINLYSTGNHPSKEGSYLISCVFYKSITGEKTSSLKYTANINYATAKKIRALVDSINFEK